ncbi:MAG: 4Fe-4S dicluster domain-containing protein [Spirochaetes bacterium]|nr:4Fe-4S dicluster domain-containing protein [Spirochaetota bacterium]
MLGLPRVPEGGAAVKTTRRELLKRGAKTGLLLLGGTALYEVVSGSELLTGGAPLRHAMAVDLRRCLQEEGCDRCAAACHGAHNVPRIADELRAVKWIWKDEMGRIFPETVGRIANAELREKKTVVLCNHCTNAPCVRVCPTGATFSREDGIVMMDQHRCIGCRYCMAACPYGSRSFNWYDPRRFLSEDAINPDYPTRTRGVVEKCDFCAERLDTGGRPLCVEACRAGALIHGNLNDPGSDLRRALQGRFALRRRAELDTDPGIYYLL